MKIPVKAGLAYFLSLCAAAAFVAGFVMFCVSFKK